MNKIDEILKIKELLDSGIITEKEFIELAAISYFDNWDCKNPNHCCIQLFKCVNEMIDNLN